MNAKILLLHGYNHLLLNGQYVVAVNYKYLNKRYLNFPAAKKGNLVGKVRKVRCSTLATAPQRCVAKFQNSPHRGSPRAVALLIAANIAHAGPLRSRLALAQRH